jgi:hypothetical protein
MPDYRKDEIRAPDKRFTGELLEEALRLAVEKVSVKIPDELGAGEARWGEQLAVQQLTTDDQQRRRKAGYLAKYSTKSTEQAGGLLHRIDRHEIDTAPVSEHIRGYMTASFDLHDQATDAIRADEPAEALNPPSPPLPAPAISADPNGLALRVLTAMSTSERVTVRLQDASEHIGQIKRRTNDSIVLDTGAVIALAAVRAITAAPIAETKRKRDPRDRRLAACAHTLGYRGHCLSKSRQWSTTFTAQRQARAEHVREQQLARTSNAAQRKLAEVALDARITAFEFVGVGHLTTADAYLAAQAAAGARENRELAREALTD